MCVSTDGKAWSLLNGMPEGVWRGITWSKELALWCMVAQSGDPRIVTSPDLETWTPWETAGAGVWFGVLWNSWLAQFMVTSNGGSYLSALSGLTVEPAKANGTPLLLDRQLPGLPEAENTPGMLLALPNPAPWTWTVAGSAGNQTLTISIPDEDIDLYTISMEVPASGAMTAWLNVDVGEPLQGAETVYTGTWRNAGLVYWSRGPFECSPVAWPWAVTLVPGDKVPVRLRYLSRGMRMSRYAITTITVS